jgi:hypothetical protein
LLAFTFAYKNGLFNNKPNPYGVFKSSISGGRSYLSAPHFENLALDHINSNNKIIIP